jgi:hypothetical protein
MFKNFYLYTYVVTLASILFRIMNIIPNMKYLSNYYESNFKDDIFIYYCLHPVYIVLKYISIYIKNIDKFLVQKIGDELIGLYVEQTYKFTLNAMFVVIVYNVFEILFNCRNTTSKPFAYYVFTILVPSLVLFLFNFIIMLYKKKKRVIAINEKTIFMIIHISFYAIMSICIYYYFLKKYALSSDASSSTYSGNIMRTIQKLRLKEYFKILIIHIVVSGTFVVGFGLKPKASTKNPFSTHRIMILSNIVTLLILYKYVFK